MDPYTDDDPEYRDTPLVSPINKPSVRTVAPPEQRRGAGGGRGGSFNRNQQQQSGYQQSSHHYSQNHHQQQYRNYNNYNSSDRYNYNSNRYNQQGHHSPQHTSQSYTREERHHHRHPTQEQKPSRSPSSIPPPSSSTTLPSLSSLPSISQLSSSDNSSSSFATLPPIQQTEDQNQPPIIQLPKQNADFISCNIPYEEGKAIKGLRIIFGPIAETDYNLFCDSKVVHDLFEKKNSIEGISHEKFTEARQKSNPYEKVGSSIFMNRAAVKLACLDSLVGLASVKRYDPVKELVFWFADLCGGPGGFTEYLLWRKHSWWREEVLGWGITLKNEQDFDFSRFHRETMPNKCFRPYYGADNTGNLYNERNIKDFAKVVKEGTKGDGVDLVTADGGFDVRGKEQYQEVLLKQLILCQVVTMFMTLRKDGDFVLKLFDIFTPFTGGIVWILYRHFEKICIIKPLSSRPANSERYIICQKLRESNPAIIIDYLLKVNKKFNEIRSNESTLSPTTTSSLSINRILAQDRQESTTSLHSSQLSRLPKEDINEIIDISEISKDKEFLKYIKQKNIEIAENQIEAIKQLLKFVENPEMKLPQEEYKKLCLQEWRLPQSEEGFNKSVYKFD
ncbi:FtsJ-like methyltransferase-domain-containing protein [Glomus cerebriforme]|uniref:Cap-specific mRNA (nucleoside-2'-O-)-methyltransferase 1 n=1 Tax=Glomus cerebriforme TaxID=658196 RepID=A0A397SGV5_9GLOM|nr:FtsJ-like methyltransferase-domain-containing protein [Glomus cerebriforme]